MRAVKVLMLAAGIVHAGGVGGRILYSFVSPNLFCLDFGYYDAACVSGITGFDLNPAGLGWMKSVSLATAFSTTKRTDARIDLQLVDSTFYFGQVVIPVSLGFEETGGWDFLGEGTKIGPFAFGFGFRRGEQLGLKPVIDTVIARHWTGTIPFSISHSTFPQIPSSAGSIPITITVSGDGRLHFNIIGNGSITYTPFTCGAAFDLGVTSFGLGATANIFYGNANVSGRGEGSFENVVGTISARSGLTDWTADLDFAGSVNNDSVYQENFKGDLHGTQFILRAGNLTKVPNLIAGELVLGGVVEEVFPATIGTGFTNFFVYTSGIPTDIFFDTSNVTIQVDSVNHRITGTVNLSLSDFLRTTRFDSAAYPFKFIPQTNLYAAGVYRISNWEFNLGAGMVGFLPNGPGWGRLFLDGGIKLHAGLDWHLGVVTALQRYQVASYSVVTPPIVMAGLGVGANLFGVGLDFALSSNISQAIIEAIASTSSVKMVDYRTLNWVGFGFGLKYDF